MLATLLESRGRSPRRGVAMSASVIAHSVLLIVLVMARARGDSLSDASDPVATNLVYVEPDHERARPRAADDARTPSQPSVELPPTPPPIVIEREVIASGMRVEFPSSPSAPTFTRQTFGRSDSVAPVRDDVMTAMAVDQPVELVPGQRPPDYPASLERAGVTGAVIVQFVVDTAGRVEDGSVVVLHAAHGGFAAAVTARLKTLRFVPARARGRLVRQLVEQRFQFEVVRR